MENSLDFITCPADELGTIWGITGRRVQQMVTEGIIPRPAEKGKYNLIDCTRAYISFLQRGTEGDALTAHRTRLARSKADIAEMERAQMAGEMVPVAQFVEVLAQVFSTIRTRLIAIPAKIAARIRMAASAVEAMQIMRDEITEALGELGNVKVIVDKIISDDKSNIGGGDPASDDDAEASEEFDDQPVG